jgi:dihydropyrimidinase
MVVTASETFVADIGVDKGKIVSLTKGTNDQTAKTIVDASGNYVLPGALDVHTHLQMPFGGTISSDGYFSGTKAALCGGTTTVFDFILQDFDEPMLDSFKRRKVLCEMEAACDYAFHIAIKDIKGDLLDTMEDAVQAGIPTFKVFMVYDFGVTDGTFYQVLNKAQKIGARISVHAENNDMVNFLVKKYLSEGKTSAWDHYRSRPEFVEAEADHRAIQWAKSLKAPLYIVHLACKEGVEEVHKARSEGYEIYAETCPQYLAFTNEVYKGPDGRSYVCSPPIKGLESQKALWEAIERGTIDTIATDHCPFQSFEKDWGKDDFTKIPNGCDGVETMYPYMLDAANRGKISFNKAVELCSTNPAKLFGCAAKGSISVGKDADIVIYDPNKAFTVTQSAMHSECDHTIWEGLQLQGYPVETYLRGELVYKDGTFLGKKGMGKYISRSLK